MSSRMVTAALAFICLACATNIGAISPTADRWSYCASSNSVNQCFDSLEKAEAWMRQEPAAGPSGRRFLEQNGEIVLQGTASNPSSILYRYAVKPRPPESFAENYVKAQRMTNTTGGTDCGCVGGVTPVCWPFGSASSCNDAPHLCHSCVNSSGSPDLVKDAILDYYSGSCGLHLADETPWPDPANSSAIVSTLNGVSFPDEDGQLLYYNGSADWPDPTQPFNKTISVVFGQIDDGQCVNVIPRARYHFQRRERYECEAGLRPIIKAINPQNYYTNIAALTELCRSAETGSITAYQLPSDQCGYGNPCVPATGAKIVDESDADFGVLSIGRHYNSIRMAEAGGGFGSAWNSAFGVRLILINSSPSYILSVDKRGNVDRFDKIGSTTSYRSTNVLGSVITKVSTDWVLKSAEGMEYQFDAAGRLMWMQRTGAPESRLLFDYAATPLFVNDAVVAPAGSLQLVTDTRGRSIDFDYEYVNVDADCTLTSVPTCKGWRISRLILPDDVDIHYFYDANGLLVRVQYTDESERIYHYGEAENLCPVGGTACAGGTLPVSGFPKHLTGISTLASPADTAVRYATYQYDHRGRVITSEHADGAGRVELTYTGLTSASVLLPEGKSRTIATAVRAGMFPKPDSWAETSTAGVTPSASYTYTASGQVQSVTDSFGVVRVNGYDTQGRVASVDRADGLVEERREERDWDTALGVVNETRVSNALSQVVQRTAFVYNTRAQVMARCEYDPADATGMAYACSQSAAPPAGAKLRWSTYTYCESVDVALPGSTCPLLGLVKSIDGPRTDIADLTTYTYYPDTDESGCATTGPCHRKGDLWKVTNALGHVTETLRYDRAGRVRASKDPNGVVTEFTWHPRGWLTARTVKGATSPADATTTYAYDAVGQVTRITQPDGDYLDYEYDAAHRLVAIEDALGNRIEYSLDAAGNRTAETTSDAAAVVKRQLTRVYDQLGRLDEQLDAQNRATAFEHDANGNQTAVVDALDVETRQEYDPLNRLKTTIQDYAGLDVETGYAYDALDRLVTVTDPKGLDTHYTYDGLGNLTQLDSPDTGITTYTHDAAGNRLTQTDARGITATHTYDALNRLTATTYPNSSLDVAYKYDGPNTAKGCSHRVGRLASATDASGTTSYCYDHRGNLTRKQWTRSGKTLITNYAYTGGDRLQSITLPTGLALTYSRNSVGQITSIARTDGGTELVVVTAATYLPFGPLQSLTFAGGATQTFEHDQNYWTDGVTGTALGLDFTLDATGNITAANDPAPASARLYTYDPLARLTDIDTGSNTLIEAFTYDGTGNRLTRQTGGGTQTYGYPPDSHRLASIDTELRSYDAMGSLTARGTDTFTYDDRQRLSAFGTSASYTYNARGERASKTVAGVTTQYVYDEAGHLIAELDPSTTPPTALRSYVWLDDRPVAVYVHTGAYAAQWLHIHTDHLGTPRAITRPAAANTIVWRWDFTGSAFGDHAPQTDPDGDATHFTFNLRFPGQYFDGESGLHYNYFRDYSPPEGRYIESDPIGLIGGINTYSYVRGGPLSLTDPLGLADLRCGPGYRAVPNPNNPSSSSWLCLSDPESDPNERICVTGECASGILPNRKLTCQQSCNLWVGLICGPIATAASSDPIEAGMAYSGCRLAVLGGCEAHCGDHCEE